MNKYIIEDSNSDVSLVVEEGETLDYFILNNNNINRKFVVKENASLNLIQIVLDNNKEDLLVDLVGEGANFKATSLTVSRQNDVFYSQKINHLAKKTTSNITNYAIALKKANIDYKTTGFIANKMSGSNCRQLCRGIIVDGESVIKSEPILLIDEYDVLASHGAAIGKMSDEELFYLMSRGLAKEEALNLIVRGLIKPIISSLPNDLQEMYQTRIEDMFRGL